MTRIFLLFAIALSSNVQAQLKWTNVDSLFSQLPSSIHIYKTTDPLDGKPNIAYYVEAELKDRDLLFTTDTTYQRRQTPTQFFEKNDHPYVVVNCTFFSFATNQNLNTIISNGKMVGYNVHTIPGRGKDTLTYRHPLGSVLGISRNRKADIAWLYTDSSSRWPVAFEQTPTLLKDSSSSVNRHSFVSKKRPGVIEKWKMETAVGGGPVLLQDGEIKITNNEEVKFTGPGITDKHPRTAMGYTRDNKLVILVVEGRNKGIAEGATLTQSANSFRDLHCVEALNLDGGGSSCMLVNGRETIKKSDASGQRPVPGVFIIKKK